ncbi:DUF3696 domain-containing protein [Hugenholtzia roseola]|uniref:DUF3696 domain-containing protein n=1 Tax=Hugenholtzia roseola TaxID=1002 RepID=UPI000478974E|nr:DUF3696 domain-containing protein [Hugenholtzia roseola]
MFKLRLNNYRGFLNEEFDFSRVNVLIGENSAGKSSVFKFLRALKQSLRFPNNRDYNLTLFADEKEGNENVDLGNYYETIYNHETDRNLLFAFEFKEDYFNFFLTDAVSIAKKNNKINEAVRKELLEEREKITQILGGKITTPTIFTCELSEDLANHNKIKTTISNSTVGEVVIFFPNIEQEVYVKGESPLCNLTFCNTQNETYTFSEIEYEKMGFTTIVDSDSLKEKIKQKFENGEADRLFWSIAFLLITQNYIRKILSDIKYINPLLSEPAERVYLKRDEKISFDIKDIKEVVYLLSGDNFLKNENLEKFKSDYTQLLSELGLLEEIKPIKENFTRELRVVVNGMENNIKDVGFGVSLQMPIFAQALISENLTKQSRLNGLTNKGETLLIEQPEVHLHPRLQAKFIETLLSIGNNNVYFIETHSEHIIRMLQILVKTKKFDITPDDVSIHYFRKDEKNMIKSKHEINAKTGELSPAFPDGFFDISFNLAFQLID